MIENTLNTKNSFNIQTISTPEYLKHFKKTVHDLFADAEDEIHTTHLPKDIWAHLVQNGALATRLPETHGGRPQSTLETLQILRTASYESLPLSLMIGIVGGLCIDPIRKYATPETQKKVFTDLLQGKTCAFAITEPGFGSDAFQMETSFIDTGKDFHLNGQKHWQGLSSEDTDWWIIAAREKKENEHLGQGIHFFLKDNAHRDIQTENYETQGLWMIPYGLNTIDTHIPYEQKLEAPNGKGLQQLMNMLCTSRLQFPGMALGFLERNFDEASAYAQTRMIGKKPLIEYDQAHFRLQEMQSWTTVCEAFCIDIADRIDLSGNLSQELLPANAIKALTTDYMQQSAQSFQQLMGGNGYKKNSRASKATLDSRPFQIFEGSNDILYTQIVDTIIRNLRHSQSSLFDFLSTFPHTHEVMSSFESLFDFSLDTTLSQRKRYALGKVIARLIALQSVQKLKETEYPVDRIKNAESLLFAEIHSEMQKYIHIADTTLATSEKSNDWNDFLKKEPHG